MEFNATEDGSIDEAMRNLGFELTIWKIQVAVLSLLFILGFVGNMVVLFMLLRNRLAVSRTIRHLIINLVVADLFVVTFCILTLAIWHYTVQWLGGDLLCRFSKYMQMFSLYASTFMITVISVDRCIAVAAPMSSVDNNRCTHRMIATAWILAAVFSIPQAVIFKVERAPPSVTNGVDFQQCVTFGSYTAEWQEQLYAGFTLFVNFVIPLNTIVVCYAVILHKLLVHGKFFSSQAKMKNGLSSQTLHEIRKNGCRHQQLNSSWNQRTARLRKARTTSLWISILIVVTFVICWGPYYARMIAAFFWDESGTGPTNIDNFIFFFGMSNSVINPVIYGAFHILKRSRRFTTFAGSQRADHSSHSTPGTQFETNRKSKKQFAAIINHGTH